MPKWTVRDSRELYNIRGWSAGLFDINEAGHVVFKGDAGDIDFEQLIQDCGQRGYQLPLLVRLPDAIAARISVMARAFAHGIAENEYQGAYRGVFPIKVNQQRRVVEDVVRAGRPYHFGLEVGSKPELMVAIALQNDPEALVIVNGYKDRELVTMAVTSRRLKRNTIVVIEQPEELDLVLAAAAETGIRPAIGVRVKLASSGSGRWSASSGDRAKFGLSMRQLYALVKQLKAADALDMLKLLHFHIGSQITAIRALEDAVREGARIAVELYKLGAQLRYFDVGGGLGVDYDGSQTDFESSVNYDVQEYVDVVVGTLQQVLDEHEAPHLDIVTESGRFLVAPSTVLVTSVLGASRTVPPSRPRPEGGEGPEEFESAAELWELCEVVNERTALRSYHYAVATRQEALARFVHGGACLAERAAVDEAFEALLTRIHRVASAAGPLHEELEHLPAALSAIYFCNFSVFQSLPDAWAVSQLFPIMPLARLDEEPTQLTVLADLTCDSDGKIDRFIDPRDVKRALPLHPLREESYHIGFFLLGAYQETLGDLHNLFGDTHAIHVRATGSKRGYRIEAFADGDLIEDVLGYMQYRRATLEASVRAAVEDAYQNDDLGFDLGRSFLASYANAMRAYTYLDDSPPAEAPPSE